MNLNIIKIFFGNTIKKIFKNIPYYDEKYYHKNPIEWIQKNFDYGLAPRETGIIVFRITYTDVLGNVFNFSPFQIKHYCNKFGLKYADLYWYGSIQQLLDKYQIDNKSDWQENLLKSLEEEYLEKDCNLSINKVPDEGIVIYKDHPFITEAFKLKSQLFLSYEDSQLEANQTNMEDE